MFTDDTPKKETPQKHMELAREVATKIFEDFNPSQQLEFISEIRSQLLSLHTDLYERAVKEVEGRKEILNRFNENATQVEYKLNGKDIEAAIDRHNKGLHRTY